MYYLSIIPDVCVCARFERPALASFGSLGEEEEEEEEPRRGAEMKKLIADLSRRS